VKKYTLKIDLD